MVFIFFLIFLLYLVNRLGYEVCAVSALKKYWWSKPTQPINHAFHLLHGPTNRINLQPS
jgi:hypothetical protein